MVPFHLMLTMAEPCIVFLGYTKCMAISFNMDMVVKGHNLCNNVKSLATLQRLPLALVMDCVSNVSVHLGFDGASLFFLLKRLFR